MACMVVAREPITVGMPVVIQGEAPASAYSVVFEDDGDTGYLLPRAFEPLVRQGQPEVHSVSSSSGTRMTRLS
jgi:hypothetical protein